MEDSVEDCERLVRHREEGDEEDETKKGTKRKAEEIKENSTDIGRGFIKQLLSTVSKQDHVDHQEKEKQEEEEGSGGIIRHIISNLVSPALSPKSDQLVHQNGDSSNSEQVINNKSGEEESGSGGGRGIFENLVSHLPSSIPDDAVPTTDEASILIHSIVHE